MSANYSNREDALGDTVVGSFDIYVVPDVEHWDGSLDKGGQHLAIYLTGADWKALFYDVFRCPKPEPYVEGENIHEYEDHYRVKFQQAIPDYPLLGQIWDMYEDVRYTSEQVKQLRIECLKVQASTTNARALEALRKLIFASDEALKVGQGLFLASD